MQAIEVRKALVKVLEEIQSSQGLDCPAITGKTKPTEALPQFDSKVWPVATGMLGKALGVPIAADANIFCRPKSCIALTVDETVAAVMDLIAAHTSPSLSAVASK